MTLQTMIQCNLCGDSEEAYPRGAAPHGWATVIMPTYGAVPGDAVHLCMSCWGRWIGDGLVKLAERMKAADKS